MVAFKKLMMVLLYTMKNRENILQKYYGKDRAAKAIYGSILIFVFIAGIHLVNGESALAVAASILVASLTIVIAEVYSEFIGITIKNKKPLSKKQAREVWDDTVVIASISILPTIFFLISNFNIISIPAAFLLSYIYCMAVLFVFSFWASRLSGFSKKRSILTSLITLFIGLAIILAKYMFGH